MKALRDLCGYASASILVSIQDSTPNKLLRTSRRGATMGILKRIDWYKAAGALAILASAAVAVYLGYLVLQIARIV